MILTRYEYNGEPGWALDDRRLPDGITLKSLLGIPRDRLTGVLSALKGEDVAEGTTLSPVEDALEVWAAGVTYMRSRVEREAESSAADIYGKVYEADRPELFFKTVGRRTIGHRRKIRIRRDSSWNVPEPELTLVVNRHLEIVGYTAGNDVSSRSIEGENPLYLPQAKTYDGSCAVGPEIVLATEAELVDIAIRIVIRRDGLAAYQGEARTSQMKRTFGDLVKYLGRETSFPDGVFLMTGTGIVPGPEFTLLPHDEVEIKVGDLTLINSVAAE